MRVKRVCFFCSCRSSDQTNTDETGKPVLASTHLRIERKEKNTPSSIHDRPCFLLTFFMCCEPLPGKHALTLPANTSAQKIFFDGKKCGEQKTLHGIKMKRNCSSMVSRSHRLSNAISYWLRPCILCVFRAHCINFMCSQVHANNNFLSYLFAAYFRAQPQFNDDEK